MFVWRSAERFILENSFWPLDLFTAGTGLGNSPIFQNTLI